MSRGGQRSVQQGPNTGGARSFLFKVVDAETGAGIPGVEIHARYWSSGAIEPKDDLVTGAEGVCAVPLPDPSVGRLDLGVLAAGYVQRFFTWLPEQFGPLPGTYELELERGVGIGGVVRSHDGRPVARATITLWFPDAGDSTAREPARERLASYFDVPVAWTDAQGRWQGANVPPRYADFTIKVEHVDFPDRQFSVVQHDNSSSEVLTLAALRAGDAVLTLTPGYSISGKVIDELGQPVPHGKVSSSRWADPQNPDAITDGQGKFTIRQLRAGSHPITVVADGFAPQTVAVETGGSAVTIQLQRGSPLRVRVVEPSGSPVAAADVALESWGDDNKLQLRELTDVDGRFEWRSAPSDVLEICVLKRGYAASRGHKLRADGEEHVITLKLSFRAVGRVVDAETGAVVPSFKAIPSYGGQRWNYGDAMYGRDGLYELRFGEERTPYFVRIMAEGYESAEAGPFDDEGSPRVHDFELHRSNLKSVARGVVLNPDGKPAARVQVALGTLERGVMIGKWQIARQSSAKPIETDAEGRFEFAPDRTGHTLVAVGREGCTRVAWAADGKPVEMRLQPWGRLEGTVRLGQPSGRRVQLHDDSYARYGGGTSLDMSDFARTSDANGRFVMEEVPAGEFDLFIAPLDGTPFSHRTPIAIEPGETVMATIGGSGWQLRGRFELPGAPDGINWSNQIGMLNFSTNLKGAQPPQGLDRDATESWKRNFWNSDEGRVLKCEQKSIALEVAADGSFFAESVRSGEYELMVHLHDRAVDRRRPGRLDNSTLLGRLSNKKVSIAEEHAQHGVLDLGTVELQSLRTAPGATRPFGAAT